MTKTHQGREPKQVAPGRLLDMQLDVQILWEVVDLEQRVPGDRFRMGVAIFPN